MIKLFEIIVVKYTIEFELANERPDNKENNLTQAQGTAEKSPDIVREALEVRN